MPSILAEISFLTNPDDAHQLRDPEYRQRIAESLYRGVAKYIGSLSGVRLASRAPPGRPATSRIHARHRQRLTGMPRNLYPLGMKPLLRSLLLVSACDPHGPPRRAHAGKGRSAALALRIC